MSAVSPLDGCPADRFECNICWHVYDPEQGDAYWQIIAGTPFASLPEYWSCPHCGSGKDHFLPLR
jgi:rubredoxin